VWFESLSHPQSSLLIELIDLIISSTRYKHLNHKENRYKNANRVENRNFSKISIERLLLIFHMRIIEIILFKKDVKNL
jgi:hypothetical protein